MGAGVPWGTVELGQLRDEISADSVGTHAHSLFMTSVAP